MIKGYIIRDEFISVMKNSTSVLDWMEGRSEYQAQLAAILIAPGCHFPTAEDTLSISGRYVSGAG